MSGLFFFSFLFLSPSDKITNLSCADAVKRRTLPAWIREGLEKMEREKQKKLEKERMEQQRSQMSKKEKKGTEETEERDGPRLPQKSKFVSRRADFFFSPGLYFLKAIKVHLSLYEETVHFSLSTSFCFLR